MERIDQTRIATRTRQQTMDWGLVLMSQGIAATIDDGADGSGWALWVSDADYPSAQRAISLYRSENPHWRWRTPFLSSGFHFDWRVLFWVLLLVSVHLASRAPGRDWEAAGCMDNSAVRAGEWWRIFTAMLLHADSAHLTSNITVGFIFLGLAMGRFGGGLGLLAACLAGAAGNVAGLVVYPDPHLGLGASGMVMGGLGLLAAQSITLIRRGFIGRKYLFRAALAGLMLFVLLGLSPDTDVVAHAVGFATGLLLGGVLLLAPPSWKNRATDTAAGIVLAALVLVTAWLAFHQSPSLFTPAPNAVLLKSPPDFRLAKRTISATLPA